MKKFKILFAICLMLVVTAFFSSCEKKYGSEVLYKGTVINTVTKMPFANTEVKVTDGEHVNATVRTDENGQFSILVKFNEINANYYLLIGDAGCAQVRREFKGFGQSEINLGEIEVEGPRTATLTTLPISSVTTDSAISGGNITNDGNAAITARGVCWSKHENPTIDDNHTNNGSGKGEFSSELIGLENGASYFVRAYATNVAGTVYGNQIRFVASGLPTVTTDEATEISATSATCGGTVDSSPRYTLSEKGICWSSTTANPTKDDSHISEVPMSGHFSCLIINLNMNTTYYVRAYATNDMGTSYGQTVIFKTSDGRPTVETTPVGENITENTITTGGNVVNDNGFSITSRGIVWSTVPYPTIESGTQITAGSGTGYFGCTIQDVSVKISNCYIRAFAINSKGVSYGEQVTVTPDNYKYCNLMTISHGGYKCKIYPVGSMSQQAGYDACENMVFSGYDDWKMANADEVQSILEAYDAWNKYVLGADVTSYQSEITIEGADMIWTSKPNTCYFISSYGVYDKEHPVPTRCTYCVQHSYYNNTHNHFWELITNKNESEVGMVFAVRKYRTE